MSDTIDLVFHRSLSDTVTLHHAEFEVCQRKTSCSEWPLMKGFEDKRSLKALRTFDSTGIRDRLQVERLKATELP